MQLTAQNLGCERGGRTVFSNVNFSLNGGELLELRGANGSGKSSLLRLIAGLIEPCQGSIIATPEECHYIGHADTNKPSLTVLENVNFWADFFGTKNAQDSLNAFDLQNLANDKTYLLSEGQRRRLALTRLTLVKREVWLLDEPMVGLDAASQNILVKLMKSHLEGSGIIIASTHTDLGLPVSQSLSLGGQ